MSFSIDTLVLSKLVSIAIFLPIYIGALIYAFWGPNKQRFDDYAALALREDNDDTLTLTGSR
jgi:cbb3-type cytochrome oxidase subunit 3